MKLHTEQEADGGTVQGGGGGSGGGAGDGLSVSGAGDGCGGESVSSAESADGASAASGAGGDGGDGDDGGGVPRDADWCADHALMYHEHVTLNMDLGGTLLLHGCHTVVTRLLHCSYAVVTRLLHCCYTVVTLLFTLLFTLLLCYSHTVVTLGQKVTSDAERQYVYLFHRHYPLGVQVRFWSPHDPKEHLKHFYTIHNLGGGSSGDGGDSGGGGDAGGGSANVRVVSGCAEHLCVQDLYRVSVALDARDEFTMAYHVTGPNKAYTASTYYNRL
jgi:hypothetical protein